MRTWFERFGICQRTDVIDVKSLPLKKSVTQEDTVACSTVAYSLSLLSTVQYSSNLRSVQGIRLIASIEAFDCD